jgi:hypothetical protein
LTVVVCSPSTRGPRNHLATGPVAALSADGREAFARADAVTSRRAFEAALADRESAEPFEGLARALYVGVDYPGSFAVERTRRPRPAPRLFLAADASPVPSPP